MTSIASPPTTDLVLSEAHGSVLLLTFNRPDRLNAWTDELEERYFQLLADADADPGVRAIVVTGAGRGFCAGADLSVLKQAEGDDVRLPDRARPRHFPLTIGKPMIAAIGGAAAGLGLVEALYCDIRFAAPAAKLTTAFARRGLIAEYGSAWLLPRLIGHSKALDLLMSGRVVLGNEALSMGLVDRVVEPDGLVDAAIAYAAELAALSSPASMGIIKRQVLRAMDSDFSTAVADADAEMLASFLRTDISEGVASYLEQRPPAFPGVSNA